MANLGWARCTSSSADTLRRGAWYPIVEETSDGQLVVEVEGQQVRISRADVRIRHEMPNRWSIVQRTGVLRPTWSGTKVTGTYAVCPHCRARQEFDGRPDALECQRCRHRASVDWTETC